MEDSRDIWLDFKPIIKRLYEVERKTLTEVKKILEKQHGFPKKPISTYESKLRNVLRLRKKLKAADWTSIYDYARAKGFDNFDLYLNGTLIPPKKARKEFRRYGLIRAAHPMNHISALPDGIELRNLSGSRARSLSTPTTTSQPPVSSATTQTVFTPEPPYPESSVPMDNGMPDLSDEMLWLVPFSARRFSPSPQSDYSAVNFGSLSPINDLNAWQLASGHEFRQSPSLNATAMNNWIDPLADFTDWPALMSPTPVRPVMEKEAVSDLADTRTAITTRNSAQRGECENSARSVGSPYLYAKYHLQNLPWNQYRLALQAMLDHRNCNTVNTQEINGFSFTLMPADGFFEHSHNGLMAPISNSSFPVTSELYDSISLPVALSARLNPYHVLAQVVYLFSNNLHKRSNDESFLTELHEDSDHPQSIQLLDYLVYQMPRSLLFGIFKISSLSIRAVWEALFDVAARHKVKSGLQLLITIALQLHPLWVNERRKDILLAAVSIGDSCLVQKLLEGIPFEETWSAQSLIGPECFCAAAACGAIGCAKLLLAKCNPNAEKIYEDFPFKTQRVSIFTIFMFEVCFEFGGKDRNLETDLGDGLDAYLQILILFIEAGANIDSAFPRESMIGTAFGWAFTCLDACFYMHRPTFDKLLFFSHRWDSHITRAGICSALSQGQDALADYLALMSIPIGMNADQCLRVTFIELIGITNAFFLTKRNSARPMSPLNATGVQRLRALLEYGVPMRAWHNWDPASCFEVTFRAAARDGLSEDLVFLLDHSIRSGADITPTTYDSCIKTSEVEVLRALIRRDGDFEDNGRIALLKAARQENYELISVLLEEGVDINSEVCDDNSKFGRQSMTLLSHLLIDDVEEKYLRDKQEVWEFFTKQGAELKLRRGHATCYQLLRSIITKKKRHQLIAFDFVLASERESVDLPALKWANLLALAINTSTIDHAILETLFRQCGVSPEPLLAKTIMSCCKSEFVDELLAGGQGVNDYSGDRRPLQAAAERLDINLVIQLLQLGASINSPTGDEIVSPGFQHSLRSMAFFASIRGSKGARFGMTALQCVCAYEARLPGQMNQQKRLIKLLLTHRADVNARAHGEHGSTAIQLLCAQAHHTLEEARHFRHLVTYLIEHGADVNMSPGFKNYTALQHCVMRGDIEQVLILVRNGAEPNAHPAINLCYKNFIMGISPSSSCRKTDESALDIAASNGRLDMTQYLLNIGGLSAIPGTTGYQGAIDLAIEEKHHAVADIIRSHIEKITEQHQRSSGIRSRHEEAVRRHAAALEKRHAEYRQFLGGPGLRRDR